MFNWIWVLLPDWFWTLIHPKDRCEICYGEKGGVYGNENIIGGLRVCDYCTAIWESAPFELTEEEIEELIWESAPLENEKDQA